MRDGMPVIDVHTHIAPERLARAVRAALVEQYGLEVPWPIEPGAVLADIRASGADLIVHLPYAHRAGVAEGMNRHSAELAAANPDVIGFATVHPDDGDPVGDLERAIAAGTRGLKVHCAVQRIAADDARMDPVFAWCERERVPVLIHAGHGPDPVTPHTGFDQFRTLMGRHPELDVCVAHLGGPEGDAFLDLAAAHPSLFLDVASVADAALQTGAGVERLLAMSDRILYGSDYPNSTYAAERGVDLLGELGFAGDALRAVVGDNAARFLRLSASEWPPSARARA